MSNNAFSFYGREFFQKYIGRENMILGYPSIKTSQNKVNLHFFHAKQVNNRAVANLGDELFNVVVNYVANQKGFSLDSVTQKTSHLYAIGSILLMGYQNATIWGSGFPYTPFLMRGFLHRSVFRKLDIRCVRGPLSRDILLKLGHNCPPIYGDPALLMPLIYKPIVSTVYDYVVIPHFEATHELYNDVPSELLLSMDTAEYKHIIDKIASARLVISGSLHGLILAETYGIPAVFIQDRSATLNFKYLDYYRSTERYNIPIAHSIQEAFDIEPSVPQNLEQLKTNLLNSFPYDLWHLGSSN